MYTIVTCGMKSWW